MSEEHRKDNRKNYVICPARPKRIDPRIRGLIKIMAERQAEKDYNEFMQAREEKRRVKENQQ